MSNSEIEIVSVKKAMYLIGCTKSVFYHKHRIHLKQATKIGRDVFYRLKDVANYKETLFETNNKFKIID
jgi:hypothetical protein